MPPLPPLWLLVLWTAFVLQAWLSAGMARRYLRLFLIGHHHDERPYKAHATVIVPFKGIDNDLVAGVRGLCEQSYPDYELLLVVQSEDDPATDVLRRELARYPHRKAQVLIAGDAGPREGQKVHNQLFALERFYDKSADDEAWVFADSDAIAGPEWLARLIAPLAQFRKTGVTTGYRWLIPQPPATFWSHIASLMNGSVASLMGKDRYNHAWGGSMAIRADTARRGDLRGLLVGALCDDYQFTRLSRKLGLRVYFVSQCLVATPVKFDFHGMFNFVHRQYLLTRVYAPTLFLTALVLTTLYAAGFLTAIGYLVVSLIGVTTPGSWMWAAGAILVAMVGDHVRAAVRRRAVSGAFDGETMTRLRGTLAMDRWATPLWMLIHWAMIVRSAFGNRMRWRGILYRLDGPQKCEKLEG